MKKTRIVIDPGHGGADPGAVSRGFGLREKDLTLTISRHIEWYLNNKYDCEVKLTRTKDMTLDLRDRVAIANSYGADIVASVHINAGGGYGFEDFVHIALSDSGDTAKMRAVIHKEIKKVLDQYEIKDRGMKKADFYMLRNTKAPAVLTETLFIDNQRDQKLLQDDNFIIDMSRAHARGIAIALGLPKKVNEGDSIPKPEKVVTEAYRVSEGERILGEWDSTSYILRHVEKCIENKADTIKVEKVSSEAKLGANSSKVKILVSGELKEIQGVFSQDMNFVSARGLLEALGYKVAWDIENQVVIAEKI